MPIAVVVAALLSFFVAVGVRNFSPATPKSTPTPTVVTVAPTGEQAATPSSQAVMTATPKPTGAGSVSKTSTPTPTQKQTQITTSTPAQILRLNTPTSTPVPADTSAPIFVEMTGPKDGTSVQFASFCFPMRYSDATNPIMVRYAFDSDSLGNWSQDYAPCYQNVPNGSHSFSVQAKDGVGNMTSISKRTFTVQVVAETPVLTVTPIQ